MTDFKSQINNCKLMIYINSTIKSLRSISFKVNVKAKDYLSKKH